MELGRYKTLNNNYNSLGLKLARWPNRCDDAARYDLDDGGWRRL